jgi:hypothetical protein
MTPDLSSNLRDYAKLNVCVQRFNFNYTACVKRAITVLNVSSKLFFSHPGYLFSFFRGFFTET